MRVSQLNSPFLIYYTISGESICSKREIKQGKTTSPLSTTTIATTVTTLAKEELFKLGLQQVTVDTQVNQRELN